MATFTKFNQFVEDVAHGVHDFTSDGTCTITIALCATADAPVAGDAVLADLTTVSTTNLAETPIVVAVTSSGQTAGTYDLVLTDETLTATGTVGPFQYIVLYNADPTSPADPLIGFYDYGSAVTLEDTETFDVDFSAYTVRLA